jgi:hypothetical protein
LMWGTPKRVSEEEGVPDMLEEEEEPPVGIEEEQETPPTSPSSHPSQRRVEERCDVTGASHILHTQRRRSGAVVARASHLMV